MQQLPPYPDAEAVVMAMLAGIAPTVTATPADISTPLIRVQRVGGSDDRVTDYPRIEVCVFYPVAQDGDTAAAWAMAEQCRQTILAARCTVVAGALCDNATTATPPQLLPWDNPNLRRIAATFVLAFRRPRV
ncbi:hypothetical protein GCM10010174_61470 [Kutzneria viridogrisea]|uniref:DUF3168 domain-containing protein n=1 Tax=Kutzneria viridogrisea TaxID=47990 RepID=A0ABR6BGC4_9PSEU|nr:hypothetical protein [Kutzneria viridogrisea]